MNSKKLLLTQHDCLRQGTVSHAGACLPFPRRRLLVVVSSSSQLHVHVKPTTVTSPSHVPNVTCAANSATYATLANHVADSTSSSRTPPPPPEVRAAFGSHLRAAQLHCPQLVCGYRSFPQLACGQLPLVSRSSRPARRSAVSQSSRPRVVCLLRPRSTFTKTYCT